MSNEKVRILVVDDEVTIRGVLRLNLETNGFQVKEADTGKKALEKAVEFHPNLIILDLGLPDMNGVEVLRQLREWTSIPILVLTVTEDTATKVNLLDAGAEDYLTKPFSMPELLARVRVNLRNRKSTEATPIFRSGLVEININDQSVKVDGKDTKLTATEFALLRLLVRDQGRVVSQQQILTEIWGPRSTENTHYLRIYIAQLRKKIESNPSSPKHLITEPGVGYRLI